MLTNQPSFSVADEFAKALDFHKKGNIQVAAEMYRKILAVDVQHFDATHLLGVTQFYLGNTDQALSLFQAAEKINHKHPTLFFNHAVALHALKREEEALEQIKKAIHLKPEYMDALVLLGTLLQELGKSEEALKACDDVLKLAPNQEDVLCTKGNSLQSLLRYEEALLCYTKAMQTKPNHPPLISNYGNALQGLKRFEEAITYYDRALAIDPKFASGWFNRGNALRALGQDEKASENYERALNLDDNLTEAVLNRGVVMLDARDLQQAVFCFEFVKLRDPNNVKANFNLGYCNLLLGNLKEGWKGYEWRWKSDDLKLVKVELPFPIWNGEQPIKNKRLLVYSEQGFGDLIQFCRYIEILDKMGAQVILVCHDTLAPLMHTLAGVTQIIVPGQLIPEVDYYINMMSVPMAVDTELATIPAKPSYLSSDSVKVAVWQEKLGVSKAPKVGIVWSGNVEYKNDVKRSIPIQQMMELAHKGLELICLQKEIRKEDKTKLAKYPKVKFYGDSLHDFSDTAALIELMDVVVTIDTSVAHLAGALGKPVWILLPFNSDWRWFLEREDSPWYPSVRLFRQKKSGDWGSVVQRVKGELNTFLKLK